MNPFSQKICAMRLDNIISDIDRIQSSIPSEYSAPKAALASSHAETHTNPGKALKMARKAKKMFSDESVLAARYNTISEDAILSRNPRILDLNSDYLTAIRKGDYRKASKVLKRLIALIDPREGHSMALTSSSVDGDSTTVLITNNGEKMVSIVSLTVLCGGIEVDTSLHAPLSVYPASKIPIVCRTLQPSSLPLEFVIEYYVDGLTWTLDSIIDRSVD